MPAGLALAAWSAWAIAATAADAAPAGASPPIDEIVVTATLRPDTTVRELPASIAVLDQSTIRAGAVQHFEELVPLVPNFMWSGEGARARYFQIRGSGELEQYEGAPNPSVGFLVDDIDFSGLGGITTTFDTARVEVLRGPQGTRYGANALAGLIYVQSAAPTPDPEGFVETMAASDGAWSAGAAGGGPVPGLEDALGYRVAIAQYRANGFRHNEYLGRDATAGREETTARARLRWRAGGDWEADLVTMLARVDDGYDDWTIFNGYTTQSDQPGHDNQRSAAGSLRVGGPLGDRARIESITGLADTDVAVSFDSDWGNPTLWAPDVYAYTQDTDRQRRTLNQELRLVSTPAGRLFGRADWVVGVYGLRLDESNAVTDTGLLDLDDAACPPPPDPGAAYCEPYATDATVSSDYDATSLALFAEVDVPVAAATRLTVGLRGERRTASYHDLLDDRTSGVTAGNHFSPTDRLWGGELALTQDFSERLTGWARLARGYRAGGFNPSLARTDFSQPGLNVSADQVQYAPEALWNYEVGMRLDDGQHWLNASVFYQDRQHMQVKVPVQLQAGDPNTFVFVTDNAQAARVLGLEADLGWRVGAGWTLSGGVGLLDTDLQRFEAEPAFDGRDFPHAPHYSFAAGATWEGGAGWFARADLTGRGSYFYDYDASTGSDRKARPAQVVNVRAGRRWGHWEAALWARNLFDEDYATRGFFFGNEPPYFPPTRYIRLGDPRQVGLTLTWTL